MDTHGADREVVKHWGKPIDVVTDAEVAFARLAGEISCPGTPHKVGSGYEVYACLICGGRGSQIQRVRLPTPCVFG